MHQPASQPAFLVFFHLSSSLSVREINTFENSLWELYYPNHDLYLFKFHQSSLKARSFLHPREPQTPLRPRIPPPNGDQMNAHANNRQWIYPWAICYSLVGILANSWLAGARWAEPPGRATCCGHCLLSSCSTPIQLNGSEKNINFQLYPTCMKNSENCAFLSFLSIPPHTFIWTIMIQCCLKRDETMDYFSPIPLKTKIIVVRI